MKTLNKTLTLTALLAMAAAAFAETTAPAPSAVPGPGGPHPIMRQMMMRRMHMLKEKLNLSQDQVSKIKETWKQTGMQIKALHQNDALTQGAFRTQSKALLESSHAQVRAILTPEQQAIFDQLPAPGFGREGGEHHKPMGKGNS